MDNLMPYLKPFHRNNANEICILHFVRCRRKQYLWRPTKEEEEGSRRRWWWCGNSVWNSKFNTAVFLHSPAQYSLVVQNSGLKHHSLHFCLYSKLWYCDKIAYDIFLANSCTNMLSIYQIYPLSGSIDIFVIPNCIIQW